MKGIQVGVDCPYCEARCWIWVQDIAGESLVVECHDAVCSGSFVLQTAVTVEARAGGGAGPGADRRAVRPGGGPMNDFVPAVDAHWIYVVFERGLVLGAFLDEAAADRLVEARGPKKGPHVVVEYCYAGER